MQIDPLLLLIAVPFVGGCLCLCVTDRLKALAGGAASLLALATLGGTVYLFMKKPLAWQHAGSVMLSADNLSAFVAMAVAFFAFLIAVYSSASIERSCGRYFGYLLMTLSASLGVVYAGNFIIMIVSWGFLAAMLYLMVAIDGTANSAAAAKKALIIVGGTDALMIFGVGIVWALTGTFAMDRPAIPLSDLSAYAAFLAIAAAALAKAGAMPFHAWVPDVAEDAPAPVTAYLPASLDKLLGIYLLARVSISLFVMNDISNLILLIVGAVTIIAAVLLALVQHNMKRLLGYHAISQVGYMVLGLGTANPIGIAGGLFHMLNHAVYKSCLFLSAGSVEKKAGTAELDKLGGLARYMPLTFVSFLIASLSISGIPPFNGFVSKWMVYQGVIATAGQRNPLWIVWLAAAMFGSALTVASFMKLLHAVFLGRAAEGRGAVAEAALRMVIPTVALASVCVLFGILAFRLPLPLFIIPAVGPLPDFAGSWKPVMATALIAAGVLIGALFYLILMPKQTRTVDTFIGGEDPEALGRVSGAEFYDTIKDGRFFSAFYRRAPELLDPYALVRKPVYFTVELLQRLHNGILPTYLVWCLLGMAGIFFFLFVCIR